MQVKLSKARHQYAEQRVWVKRTRIMTTSPLVLLHRVKMIKVFVRHQARSWRRHRSRLPQVVNGYNFSRSLD